MASDMRNRILRGFSAGMLGQLLNVAGRLLIVPLFLNAWGAEVYGEWLLLSAVPAWLALSDLGGQVYFINRLTSTWAVRDASTFRQLLGTALAIFLLVPGGLFLLFTVATLVLPVHSWLGVVVTPAVVAKGVLLLLAFQVWISLPQGLVLGVYRAIGALPRGVMLGNVMLVAQLVLTAGVLAAGGGMLAAATVQFLPVLVVIGYALRDLAARLPERGLFDPRNGNRATAQEALHPSLHFFGIQMAQALAIQGSILIVGWTLGAVQVAVFATLRTLINLARQALGLLSHSAWPEFTRLDAARERDRLNRLFLILGRLTLLGTLALVLALEFFGREFFELWLGGRLSYNANAMRAFEIYVLLTTCWTLNANLLMATNRHEALARWQIAFTVLSVVLCYIGALTGALDRAVFGLVYGEALPMIIVTITLLRRSEIGLSARLLVREALPPLMAAAAVAVYPMAASVVLLWLGGGLIRLRYRTIETDN